MKTAFFEKVIQTTISNVTERKIEKLKNEIRETKPKGLVDETRMN